MDYNTFWDAGRQPALNWCVHIWDSALNTSNALFTASESLKSLTYPGFLKLWEQADVTT